MSIASYVCPCCGKEHIGLPFSFAADFPDPYANMNSNERDSRAIVGSDQCIIDQEQFYIRGCIEIPIRGTEDEFIWGVWARVKEEVYDEISRHWEVAGREHAIGPYKGLLANSLSIYPSTLNVRLEIQIRPVGTRPLFIVEDLDNPMRLEQRTGLLKEVASEYACRLLRMAQC